MQPEHKAPGGQQMNRYGPLGFADPKRAVVFSGESGKDLPPNPARPSRAAIPIQLGSVISGRESMLHRGGRGVRSPVDPLLTLTPATFMTS